MKIPLYQIDAFTSHLFRGNPAAVCPLDQWLDDEILQAIAAENNLSETAFFVEQDGSYALRWFTPECEVDLCGHATLASAFVLMEYLIPNAKEIQFLSKSGPLKVKRDGELLALDFPARAPVICQPSDSLVRALGGQPLEILSAMDYLVVYSLEDQVRALKPDMELLRSVDRRGVIVTAPGHASDFVSRFFAPGAGIPEDPVTGSAHCTLTPYWAERLGKNKLHALQVSQRGGELFCELRGERVQIAGRAVPYLQGTISL